jgi:hypothetical protein
MKQYQEGFKNKIAPKFDRESGEFSVKPFRDAQFALAKAAFVKQERQEFFDGAYVDILSDLFVKWLQTDAHCTKEREYLYSCAMALGSIKQQLISYEMYGKNADLFGAAVSQKDTQPNEFEPD